MACVTIGGLKDIHLINPMRNPAGGSEHRTISLFEVLSEVATVQLWAEEEPHSAFLGRVPMTKIGPPARFPRGGTVVFVGTYFSIGGWIKAAQPERVILVHNLDYPDRLRQVRASLQALGLGQVEVVYSSPSLQENTPEISGTVEQSPIGIDLFSPASRTGEKFTVGRLSRDLPDKFHPDDPGLYRKLAASGVGVRVLGGKILGLTAEGIETYPENAMPAAPFLKGLDCFIYRIHPAMYETFGRVVFEAMACGLPVVVEPRHGYRAWLRDGENAVFASTDQEFLDAIGRIREDVDWAAQLGRNGRATVEEMYGPAYRKGLQEFYLR